MRAKYRYLFGPVPSRRLGMSLGVDLVPHKTCTLDCVYCEVGRTTRHTTQRGEYILTGEIIEELDDYLASRPRLDAITFSGFGEPLLHSGIGEVIRHLKKNHPQYRIALLASAAGDDDATPVESPEPRSVSQPDPSQTQGPPVEEGEVRTVSIDTLGDQGDGIAKVERGFIVIVPGTKPGDRVEVEITDVKETVAFAETVGEATVR